MMILSGIFSIVGLGIQYRNLNSYVNGAAAADTAVKMCRIDANIAARNVREMVINDDKDTYAQYRARVEEKLLQIGEHIEVIRNTGIIEEELTVRYETAMNSWGQAVYVIMNEIEAGNREAAEKMILEQCAPALNDVVSIAKEFDEATDELKEDALRSNTVSAIAGIALVLVFILIAAILATKIGHLIIESIVVPLRAVETVANELAAGNLHSNLDYRSDDEIGSLAHSLRKSIRVLGSYIDDISRAMNEFSNGNFDVQPEVEWKGDFVGILDAFMLFERSMANTVKSIHGVADQVKGGSDQVAASSLDLAQGASDQAGVTQELTATLESVSARVIQNAEDAKNISKEVENVGVEIIQSNGKMQEMVDSMSEISQSSAEISKIIATINDIASQTNLLALNASIEAARAGEAGKGFAVVADQVSLLAAQSANAAKESTVLIESSVKAVEKGIVIADETAKQLENVVEGSKIITEKVNGVATALDMQAESIAQINEGVSQINDVVQTNSATSEECAAASQEMSSQADTLEDLISQFKVGTFED